MSTRRHSSVFALATQSHRKAIKTIDDVLKRHRSLRLLKTQLPAFFAIAGTLVLITIKGESAGVYTIVILLLLAPII